MLIKINLENRIFLEPIMPHQVTHSHWIALDFYKFIKFAEKILYSSFIFSSELIIILEKVFIL